jgi:signal transduction histidine kinase
MAIDTTQLLERAEVARTRLERQNTELAQGARAKGTFLANVSHELRTPLTAIIGFADLLGAGAFGTLDPVQQDGVETIVRNSRHLLALINDVLDIAKVEAGKLELHLVRTDVRETVEGVLRDAGSLAARKRQRVVAEIGAGPLTVVADEVRLRQVLFNLVSNAAKFTPEGGEITVRIVRTTAPLPVPAQRAADRARSTGLAPRDAVWVAVGDTGPGIRTEDMGRLFHEFSQVNPEHNRQHEGSGLGLALCKRFIELHGGTIGADSVYGLGSTFWFILPVDGPLRRPTGATVTLAPSLAT